MATRAAGMTIAARMSGANGTSVTTTRTDRLSWAVDGFFSYAAFGVGIYTDDADIIVGVVGDTVRNCG